MSIATEISRLQSAKASIKSAIEGKGVTVPSATLLDGYAALISSIPTGGTGKKVVAGTFTASTTGGAQSVTIPYNGNGYPLAAVICLSGGLSSVTNPTWGALVQRYAVGFIAMYKNDQATAPTYTTSGTENAATVMETYKNSATSAASYARSGDVGANLFSSSNAGQSVTTCVRFKSKNTLSVNIQSGTYYGLVAGMDYDYFIIYSE